MVRTALLLQHSYNDENHKLTGNIEDAKQKRKKKPYKIIKLKAQFLTMMILEGDVVLLLINSCITGDRGTKTKHTATKNKES